MEDGVAIDYGACVDALRGPAAAGGPEPPTLECVQAQWLSDANMCSGDDAAAPARKQRAVVAGAIEVAVAAMRAHPQVEKVQEYACSALHAFCSGGAGVRACRRLAAQAGGRTAVVAAMQAHPDHGGVQRIGQQVLGWLPMEV